LLQNTAKPVLNGISRDQNIFCWSQVSVYSRYTT